MLKVLDFSNFTYLMKFDRYLSYRYFSPGEFVSSTRLLPTRSHFTVASPGLLDGPTEVGIAITTRTHARVRSQNTMTR